MLVDFSNVRELFVGLDVKVPLLSGDRHSYVNLDNAATTPALRSVAECVDRSLQWYSSVHRGTGYKSLLSTHCFERCRQTVADFVGVDPDYHTVVFCGNTTDAINRLCCRFPVAADEVVLTSVMEHHSNLLPWRFNGKVDYVRAKFPCGMLELAHLEQKLREYGGKARLVAVTGASNITGLIPPLRQIARLAHQHGAYLLVDASQLIAHRPLKMGHRDDPERIDFLAFSGHKIYAPFGSGALIGPRDVFSEGRPGMIGGGAVDFVTLDTIKWKQAPEKEEAGTPNLIGICAMAQAMETLEALGMEDIAMHESRLTGKLLEQLEKIDGIEVFGGCSIVNLTQRTAVIPLQAQRYHHALLAAILGYEWGIAVRNGCFCAHPYVVHLLQISGADLQRYFADVQDGDYSTLPGFVRVSLGLYNTEDEIAYLAEALTSIMRDGPKGSYRLDRQTGEYRPESFAYDFPPMHGPGAASPRLPRSLSTRAVAALRNGWSWMTRPDA